MDFDLILDEIGEFGKFQLVNYLLICLPVLYGAANSLSYVFTARSPNYRFDLTDFLDVRHELLKIFPDALCHNAIQKIQNSMKIGSKTQYQDRHLRVQANFSQMSVRSLFLSVIQMLLV